MILFNDIHHLYSIDFIDSYINNFYQKFSNSSYIYENILSKQFREIVKGSNDPL
jgi:hypothetical protein